MGKIIRGVEVRIIPSDNQVFWFHKNFGCSRKVYNETLGKYNTLYELDNSVKPNLGLFNDFLKESKQELPYLMEVESTSLQQSVRDLNQGFSNFFKNPNCNHPVFHKKGKTRLSFRQTIPSNKKIIQDDRLFLRKYGSVKFKTSREYWKLLNDPETKFNNITITYDGIHYYAIINIETTVNEMELTHASIGVDINSNRNGWLVLNNGIKEHFNVDHENQMIGHLNRLMAKCKPGSRRWKRLHQRLKKWYNKRTNKLNDYTNKISKTLVEKYDTIVFEKNYPSIKILIGGEQNMIFPLSRFVNKLQYKFEWYKSDAEGVVFVDAYNTSKTCHACKSINTNLDVKTRKWICPECGKELDRDINSAINILNRWDSGDSLEATKITVD